MSDRRAMLEAFADALGAVTTLGLNEMAEKDRRDLAKVLESGTGGIWVTTILDPLQIVGALRMVDPSIPPSLLFRLDGDVRTPARGTH